MNLNIERLKELRNSVTEENRRKSIIVLNPDYQTRENNLEDNSIVFDAANWKISEKLENEIQKIIEDNKLLKEEKIIAIYERICTEYVYDDNLISYIQKNDDDSYDLPDWYGRAVDGQWEKNRETHNRRICFELSRYLAKALEELYKDDENCSVCIFWDKAITHYFVGISNDDCNATLDLDDFNKIKDLTRVKTDLTIEGIKILDDKGGKLKKVLDYYNVKRNEDSTKEIENKTINNNQEKQENEPDDIQFLRNTMDILLNEYNIDSQGLFEYTKEIVDMKLGAEARKKIWKKIEDEKNKTTRYIRCLIVDVKDNKYIIDVDNGIIRPFDLKEMEKEDSEFIPFKNLKRDYNEIYNGL